MDAQLQGVTHFWEAKLDQRLLLNESTLALIELTIKCLVEPVKAKGES